MSRVRTALMLTLTLCGTLGVYAASPSTAAAWPGCDPATANKFLGNGRTSAGLKGVYAEIEFVNESLCVQGSPLRGSWSLSWVSLDGPQTDAVPGIDIFQGGYAKCPAPAVGSCPWNSGATYTWVYYAREQGSCGAAFNTGFVKIANAAAGIHFFQVSKVGANYNFYVDEVLKYQRTAADVDTCWPGVTSVEWQNEMLNNNDQGGGTLANHQSFKNVQYQNASGWHNEFRALSSLCDANSNPAHWHCRWSSASATEFLAWDDRAP